MTIRRSSEGLAAVEVILRETPEPYCFGEAIIVAEICLMPQVYNAARSGINVSPFKRINSIVERLNENPAFAAAHPDKAKP